jgi:diacylglycerol kinase family enzyme
MRYICVISSRAGTGQSRSLLPLLSGHFPGPGNSLFLDPPDALIDAHCLEHRSEELRLVAVGGDGTIRRLLSAAVKYDVPIGILPNGTANDLARAIGLKGGMEECCRVIQADKTRAIDLIEVNGRLFATCGGLGLPSYAAFHGNRRCRSKGTPWIQARILRKTTYLGAALRELCRDHSVEARIENGSPLWSGRAMAVVFSNQSRFGALFSVSPKAVDNDGIVDLCVIRDPGSHLRELGIVLQAALGRKAILPGVTRSRLCQARILTDRVVPFFGDGEILAHDREFKITILPRTVRFIVPERPAAGNGLATKEATKTQKLTAEPLRCAVVH